MTGLGSHLFGNALAVNIWILHLKSTFIHTQIIVVVVDIIYYKNTIDNVVSNECKQADCVGDQIKQTSDQVE